MDAPPIAPFGLDRTARRVVRPRRRLRAGLSQLGALVCGLALGLLLPRVDGGSQIDSGPTVNLLRGVGLAVLGVTGLIFSLLFLVVQWAAGNYSPRLTLFRTDPVVWRTFAFVLGLLVYVAAAALAIGSRPTVSVAVPVVTGVLTVVVLALVRNLQLRAFKAIQLPHVLNATCERAHEVVDSFYPLTAADPDWSRASGSVHLPPVRTGVTWSGLTTTLQQLDILRLTDAAGKADSVVVMRVPVGATLQRDMVVADIRGGTLTADQVLASLRVGQERTFHQDPLFAVRLLADIGLRALSPAVNDPATAVQVLDALDGLLRRLAPVPLDARSVTDDRGTVRMVLCLPNWTDFVVTALDDLCNAALGSPMVLLRARNLLSDLSERATPERRPLLRARFDWVGRELTARYPLSAQQAATNR